jgi:hypothetical protein
LAHLLARWIKTECLARPYLLLLSHSQISDFLVYSVLVGCTARSPNLSFFFLDFGVFRCLYLSHPRGFCGLFLSPLRRESLTASVLNISFGLNRFESIRKIDFWGLVLSENPIPVRSRDQCDFQKIERTTFGVVNWKTTGG